jgi:hypothetical protein
MKINFKNLKNTENMEIEIEQLLENAGECGLSIKQLKSLTDLTKNKIMRIIFNSENIDDCVPYIHGSGKIKIKVFVFKPNNITYIQRKKMIGKRNLKKTDLVEENTN